MTAHVTGAIDDMPERVAALIASDPEIAALVPSADVIRRLRSPAISYAKALRTLFSGYAERPALAVRTQELRRNARGRMTRHVLPAFSKIAYGELGRQVEAIAACWQNDPELGVREGEFVAFLSFTGAQMLAIDLACAYTHALAVPLQANLGKANGAILDEVKPACLVASIDNLELAAACLLDQRSIRSLIIIDTLAGDADEGERIAAVGSSLKAAGRSIAIIDFAELVERGQDRKFNPPIPDPEGPDATAMIMYTSGSTGAPKGAIIHEAIFLSSICGLATYQPTVSLAYAPMNHFAGRNQILTALAQGGTAYFSLRSDLSTFFEDVRLANPTTLFLLPRICEIIFQHYQTELNRRLANGVDEAAADAALRAEMKAGFLGTRLLMATTGSSPTAPEVRQFIRDCFCIPFIEGYGCTEAGGGIAASNKLDPAKVIAWKLEDAPELGYRTIDQPHPRGELLVKTRLQIKGYYNRPEATAAIFDAEGYLKTGDIVEDLGEGKIAWLDRRNNVIKLSQGEFVAIGLLESAILANSPLIAQIYLYASSHRAFLLAVVVPDMGVAAASVGYAPEDAELHSMVMGELRRLGSELGLKSFEIPRNVLIEVEPFTLENGLLSSLRKPLRPSLKARYGERLEALYQEMDRQNQAEFSSLRQSGVSMTERVASAMKAQLGLAVVDPASKLTYRDLGGDSLGAVAFAALLEELTEVDVPISQILGPEGSARGLATYIESVVSGGARLAKFSSVHGEGAVEICSDQLTLPAFFDQDALSAASLAVAAERKDPATVLLTGATGFLGRFLCAEWLERVADIGGKVIALVRAESDAAGRARLFEAIGRGDTRGAERFARLAADHLEVIAADLGRPAFGLGNRAFQRLAEEVDRIVHPGALVNHRFGYSDLFGPNVAGTAELLRLALTTRQKPFDYVSTVGVPHSVPGLEHSDEDTDIRMPGLTISLRDTYAFGYSTSKWAGEVLMRDANERYGLPVTVFRPSMILGHSTEPGQINVPDMFIRLLFSLVTTGVAPASFYGPHQGNSPPHYDGTPVDILARAIVALSLSSGLSYRSFNALNLQADGVSFDTIVSWIASAGYRIDRVTDYDLWHRLFGERLQALPESKRRHSSLQIVDALSRPMDGAQERAPTTRYQEALSRAGLILPSISQGLIHKYLDDIVRHGLLEPAQPSS